MNDATVSVHIDGKPYAVGRDRTLLDAIMYAGVLIDTACGGSGRCHLCRIRIEGDAQGRPPPTETEHRALGNLDLARGVRLACQVEVRDGMSIAIERRRRRGR